MFDVTNVLERIETVFALKGGPRPSEASATPRQIQHAVDYARDKFDIALPATQILFWERCNGLNFNGLFWYRAEGIDTSKTSIPTIADANDILGDATGFRFVHYGDGDMDSYVYDIGRNLYMLADKSSLSKTAIFPSFEALLCYALDFHIAQSKHRPVPEASVYQR